MTSPAAKASPCLYIPGIDAVYNTRYTYFMELTWLENDKARALEQRWNGITFEILRDAASEGGLLAVRQNKNYPGQRRLVIRFRGYVWAVATVPEGEGYRMITYWKSRALNKEFGG